MPRPALIEFSPPDGQRLYLIFQSKPVPLLNEEIHGNEIWPIKCPDDGALFLEGCPHDYVNETICLDAPDNMLMFTLSPDMQWMMEEATACRLGEVKDLEEGGRGPGFTFDGVTWAHDEGLGISTERPLTQSLLGGDTGVIVLIDRASGEYALRKYYDEDNPSPLAKAAKGKQQASEADGQAEDVDMDGEEGGEDEQEAPSEEEDLASSMKVLRLKGE